MSPEQPSQAFSFLTILDIAFKGATLLIALTNLFFVVRFFKLKDKKEDIVKERDRRINWLKTLVLDYNFKNFYIFFDNIEPVLNEFKKSGLSDDEKQGINERLGDHFVILRRKFIDILLAVDQNLYDETLQKMDGLQDHITDSIFDQGINLSHTPKFNNVIAERVNVTKTEVIKLLFSYSG